MKKYSPCQFPETRQLFFGLSTTFRGVALIGGEALNRRRYLLEEIRYTNRAWASTRKTKLKNFQANKDNPIKQSFNELN